MNNNMKKVIICLVESSYICNRPSQSIKDRAGRDIDGIQRPTMPFVGQAKGKGVYGRYHSVCSNFATLILCTEIMQR